MANERKRFCNFLVILVLSLNAVTAQSLSLVVPADGPPARDAHFNWVFESSGGGAVQMGQFACGSYWVAPATGDTGVKVLSLEGKTDDPNWHDLISCDADPITENHGLLDGSNNYGSYNAAENIIPNLPITYTPGANSCVSLVAAMQRNEDEAGEGGTNAIKGEVVDAYCVVTILASVPANAGADMIRPNIIGANKEFLTWADFDLSRIQTYGFLSGKTTAEWADVALRWRHSIEVFGMRTEIAPDTWKAFSEGGRAFRSHLLISDYAAGTTATFNNDLLALFSSTNSLEEKKPALAAMLSYGLDIYHARYDNGTANRKGWTSGAGQWGGQYLPPVFLAALLYDNSKANELKQVAINSHGEDIAELGPQELRQVTRGVTGVLLWGDYTPFNRDGNVMIEGDWRYWSDFNASDCYDGSVNSCSVNEGKKTAADPYGYIDGPANKPGSSYMSVSFGGVRGLAAAMLLIPEIREVVNTDDPIEYADRVTRHGLWTAPDPVAIPSVADQTNGCSTWWSAKNCVDWGISWGADPSDIRFAIEGGSGRFTSLHGEVASTNYESSRAKNNWASIIALYDGDTYEDNTVLPGTLVSPEILFEPGADPKAHIHSPNYDVEIRYTLDSSDPSGSSSLYTGPVSVVDGQEVRAKAFQTGKTASAIRSKVFLGGSWLPSIPGGLVTSNITSSSIDLDWNASLGEVTGYYIYINGANPVTTSATSVTLEGLDPSTYYRLTISAYNDVGESNPSSYVSVITDSIEVVVDNTDGTGVSITGVWLSSTHTSGYYGSNYIHDENSGKGTKSITFTPDLPRAGIYGVYIRYTDGTNRSSDVPVDVLYSGGTASFSVNQKTGGGTWVWLGSYPFDAGALGSVILSNDNSGYVIADSVRFVSELEPDVEAPSIPTGLVASNVTTSTVDLSWNASSDNIEVVGYNVYIDGLNPVSVTGTNTTITGLADGTTYNFTVSAIDASANESTPGSAVTVATDPIEIIMDNTDISGITMVGEWISSNHTSGYYGSDYIHDGDTGKGTKSIDFTPDFPVAGVYGVYIRYTSDSNRASDVPVDVVYSGGTASISVNQKTGGGTWVLLGSYPFDVGTSGSIIISNDSGNGYVIADAVRFVKELSVDLEVPSAPTGLVASNITTNTVDLNWNASSDNVGVTSYKVYIDGFGSSSVTGTSANISGLMGNTVYNFTVSAIDAATNESALSNSVSVTTDPVEIIIDNTDLSFVTKTGTWFSSTYTSGYYGSDYLHDDEADKGTKSVTFTPDLPVSGTYSVYIRYTDGTSRASDVPVDVVHSGGTASLSIDQKTGGGSWVLLGSYNFNAGISGSITISNDSGNGYVIADAVRFVNEI